MSSESLTNVVPFIRSASYYFEKGNYYYQQNKLKKALLFYKKTIEVEPENSLYHYNLACVLSRMGYLEKANEVFSFIIHDLDPSLTECYFLMAVNYGLLDMLDKARNYLNLYLQFSPEGDMAEDAAELLFALTEEEEGEDPLLDNKKENETVTKALRKDETEIVKYYQESGAMQRFLWEALYHDDDQVVEKSIHMYGLLGKEAGEVPLKEFVRNPWITQRLRLQALLQLKNMGVKGQVAVFMKGSLEEVDLKYYPLKAPRWLHQWQEVIDCTLANMRRSKAYDGLFYDDLLALWIDYLNNIYPDTPYVKKTETWSAALEYALARYHFLSLTQRDLASQYGVSPSSISNKYREINKVLNIDHRAYHNMLKYLTQREKD